MPIMPILGRQRQGLEAHTEYRANLKKSRKKETQYFKRRFKNNNLSTLEGGAAIKNIWCSC